MTSSYQLLIIILPIITTPYISRVLSPEGIGLYSYTYTITQYFVLFATLGTVTYGSREIAYYQSNKQKRSEIFWGITFLSWATGAISLLIFYIFIFLMANIVFYFFGKAF
uniref:oligosaccharide flippase family protein n=1 Tax=Lactococcus sp. TaxID=44273 RepID=UPI003242081F